MSDQPRIGVAAAIRHYGNVLVGLRQNPNHGPGTWSFPGGWLEHGETILQCAAREAYEETGLKVRPYGHGEVFVENFFPNGIHCLTHYVTCEWLGGQAVVMEPDKMTSWKWTHWSKLTDMPLFLPVQTLLKSPLVSRLISL